VETNYLFLTARFLISKNFCQKNIWQENIKIVENYGCFRPPSHDASYG
jgi:ferredoxin-fold anticodon binding domain-containing protein